MGFFSWDCEHCGKSARCQMAVSDTKLSFQSDVVICFANGDRVSGEYDGYGRVGQSLDLQDVQQQFTLYHLACWERAGHPGYKGQSKYSADQGWFFDVTEDELYGDAGPVILKDGPKGRL